MIWQLCLGGTGHTLTILITVAGCAVFPFRLAGAAVGSCRRRGRSSTGSSTFTFIQETVHIISTQEKQHIQRCPCCVKDWRYLYKNIHCIYCKCDQFTFYILKCTDLSCKVNNFNISCVNWPTYGLSTATTFLLTNHCSQLT